MPQRALLLHVFAVNWTKKFGHYTEEHCLWTLLSSREVVHMTLLELMAVFTAFAAKQIGHA